MDHRGKVHGAVASVSRQSTGLAVDKTRQDTAPSRVSAFSAQGAIARAWWLSIAPSMRKGQTCVIDNNPAGGIFPEWHTATESSTKDEDSDRCALTPCGPAVPYTGNPGLAVEDCAEPAEFPLRTFGALVGEVFGRNLR